MVIKPRVKGSLALNSHPMGCKKAVEDQINFIKNSKTYEGAKKVLILGASSGYGLATRISLAFGGSKADTIGVSFEKNGNKRKPGSAGWYNNIWFKEAAEKEGLVAKNFIGDAFSHDMRDQVIEYIKEEFGGEIDLLVYSLASGVRQDPDSGELYRSQLKPKGESLTGPTFNVEKESIEELTLDPATTEDEVNTIKVMGGEDWSLWVDALTEAGVMAKGSKTLAYSYIGADVTRRIYREGTIGGAKEHLENTVTSLDEKMKNELDGRAYVAVNRAIVTKASAFIPIFPLYATVLFKVMDKMGLEEDAITHTHRLYSDMIFGDSIELDSKGRIRPDNWEMKDEVQREVMNIYKTVTPENFKDVIDFERYRRDFMQLSGFEIEGVDYDTDIDLEALMELLP